MDRKARIPVVDFSPLSIDKAEGEFSDINVHRLALDLVQIFSEIGFVYLKNTGISFDLINQIQIIAEHFFRMPNSAKSEFAYENQHGWIQIEQESINERRSAGDLKECLNFTKEGIDAERIPRECGNMTNDIKELFSKCTLLSYRILLAIATGLKLEDSHYLIKCHNVGKRPNNTVLRLLYYPPLPQEIKPDQVRLGEHTDYGSLTLLFQDDQGGLEVRTRDGNWIEALPIADTVLVNIADLLQRWTSDRLLSTPHRVLNPVDKAKQTSKRQSIAFFFHPDKDTLITSLDGSNKYSPILEDDFLKMRLRKTYRY